MRFVCMPTLPPTIRGSFSSTRAPTNLLPGRLEAEMQPPTRGELTEVIVEWLRRHPCRRLSEAELARSLSTTPGQLRRAWRASASTDTIRDVMIETRIRFAAGQIRRGIKIEAARRLSGFQHVSNFNTQFRRRFGCLPHQYRRPTAK